jgi:hypothetical protein
VKAQGTIGGGLNRNAGPRRRREEYPKARHQEIKAVWTKKRKAELKLPFNPGKEILAAKDEAAQIICFEMPFRRVILACSERRFQARVPKA